LLPTTILALLLSERSGRLAERIGPRLQMTAGPLICAAGLLLALRVGPTASYFTDVLPAVTVFGLGLACLVAPLTATALSSAPEDHAGVASGVNNAVARAGSLIAIAALPAASGLGGRAYLEPSLFLAGYHRALWVCIVALLVGAGIAGALISNRRDIDAGAAGAGRLLRAPVQTNTAPRTPRRIQASAASAIR
jgi:MFS family permease